VLVVPQRLKFGVYLPEELANELSECMKVLGVTSKSRIIQEALRLFINENRWRLGGSAVGTIGVIYDHTVPDVDESLTDIQHDYLDIVVSTIHVHLDKRRCMLNIIVKGNVERIKELLSKLINVRGVLFARPLLLKVESESK